MNCKKWLYVVYATVRLCRLEMHQRDFSLYRPTWLPKTVYRLQKCQYDFCLYMFLWELKFRKFRKHDFHLYRSTSVSLAWNVARCWRGYRGFTSVLLIYSFFRRMTAQWWFCFCSVHYNVSLNIVSAVDQSKYLSVFSRILNFSHLILFYIVPYAAIFTCGNRHERCR